MISGERILVTGGAGAIGSNLVARLAPDNDIVVLDDLSSGHRRFVSDGALLVEGSILDRELLERAFEGGIDRVFHLATLFANQNSVEHPERDLETNGMGTLRVLERAAEAGVRRFVYTSSSCVYGNTEGATLDEDLFQPSTDTPYAISKFLGEQYTRFWHEFHGLPGVVVRLFNCYGPGELPGPYRNVIPNFFARAHAGEPLPITGTGRETRDFTYVEDVVEGLLLAGTVPGATGGTFNLGSGIETSIMELAEAINEIADSDAGIALKERRGWDSVLRRRAGIERAQRVLGFEARTDLETGLERTWAWLLEHALGDRESPRKR